MLRHALGRVGAVAIVVTLFVACAGSPASTPITTASAPATTAAAVATPASTASPAATALPPGVPTNERLWGDWIAHLDRLPGIGMVGPRIQLSVDWQAGIDLWVQPYDGDQLLQSTSVAAAANQIRLIAKDSISGCRLGDEGTYLWFRSPGGLYLKLDAIEEACPARRAALERTWVHSLGAVNDGGTGVALWAFGTSADETYMLATLPSMRMAMIGPENAFDIHSFDHAGPQVAFVVLKNPLGLVEPCSPTSKPQPIDPTTDAFVDYVEGLPGVSVSTAKATVGGRKAVHLTTTSDASVECGEEIVAFWPDAPGADDAWGFRPGEPLSLWIVDMGADTNLIWYHGEGVTPADEAAVIESIQFIETLPTP
jgi:hypothetical protein